MQIMVLKADEEIPDFELPESDTPTTQILGVGQYPSPKCRFDTMVAGYFGTIFPGCVTGLK
jgi:hypothetical protein